MSGDVPDRRVLETRRHPSRPDKYLHLLDCGHVVERRPSVTKRKAKCGHCLAMLADERDRRAIWDRWRPEPVRLKVVA